MLQTITQMRLSGMPIDCAAWWSSATARSARPVPVFWKKAASSDERRQHVLGVDQDAALEGALEEDLGLLRHADVQRVDVAAPDRLAEAVEEVGDAERGHEQHDVRLVHQRAQHQPLDEEGERDHDEHRGGDRQRQRQLLHDAHQRQRREEHHGALREVEDAGGLEDQHQAQRHERVEDPGHEPAEDHLDPLRQPGIREEHRRHRPESEQHEERDRQVPAGCIGHQCFTPR
jgi:hypothetical protein